MHAQIMWKGLCHSFEAAGYGNQKLLSVVCQGVF